MIGWVFFAPAAVTVLAHPVPIAIAGFFGIVLGGLVGLFFRLVPVDEAPKVPGRDTPGLDSEGASRLTAPVPAPTRGTVAARQRIAALGALIKADRRQGAQAWLRGRQMALRRYNERQRAEMTAGPRPLPWWARGLVLRPFGHDENAGNAS